MEFTRAVKRHRLPLLVLLLFAAPAAAEPPDSAAPPDEGADAAPAAESQPPPAPARPGALQEVELVDQVRVKGERLEGQVINLEREHLEFDPEYGKGTLEIAYSDIEALLTQREFYVFYDEGGQVTGRLLGVEGGVLLVGDDYARAYRVPLDEIEHGVARDEYEESLLRRLRVRYRYWNANFDLGFNFEEGAINKRKIDFALDWERRKEPTRWTFHFDYAFETQQQREGPILQTKDEFLGITRFEYALKGRIVSWGRHFVPFGLIGAERDLPRGVKIRTYPGLGIGYRLLDSEQYFLQPFFGFGMIYEDFVNFGDNTYASALLGIEGSLALPFGSEARGSIQYWPGLVDASRNWLFRWNFSYTVPIWDPLAFKIRFTHIADNNPVPEVGNNKFTTVLGISFVF